ncbi:MAG: RNA polymerase sigma factor [Tidjanibacter sp.]|nr:RNA polymerase sigma factor [Tidjanibacter sp.]
MTIESIIRGCQNGDKEARRELYERYASAMFSLVRRYIRVRAAAEDVFHDGFVVLYTKIGDYRGEGSFEGWMRRIFINTALSHLRKNGSSGTVDEDVSDLPPSAVGGAPPEALGRLEDRELLRLVEQLPEGYQTVLMLHAVEGYSHAEVAQMLSISEATSRTQFLRAKMRLAAMIESQNNPKR